MNACLGSSAWLTRPAIAAPTAAAAAAAAPPPVPARRAPRHAARRALQRRRWVAQAEPGRSTVQTAGSSGLSAAEEDRLCEEMAAFLRDDLPHLFDDQGIDASKYDEKVVFEDPITYYSSIQGYLFNIAFLKKVFQPTFVLHDVRRTGPLELTTRWTMTMGLAFAPGGALRRLWDPKLTFTGTSIMWINPQTGRFNRHADTWDAVQQQGYFSLEAFVHMLSQVMDVRKGPLPAGAAPEYEVLKKRRDYEVRRYQLPPAGAVPLGGNSSSGGNQTRSASSSGGSLVYAVGEFGGAAGEQQAAAAAQALARALAADGLQPAAGSVPLLAACSEAEAASPLLRKNEVFQQLQSFVLW